MILLYVEDIRTYVCMCTYVFLSGCLLSEIGVH